MKRKIEPVDMPETLTFTTQTFINKKPQKYTERQKNTELLFQEMLDNAISDIKEKEGIT